MPTYSAGTRTRSLLAVRSSSPEEDFEGTSFAGGYETTLGVTAETLDDAIRRSFASSLDERVFIYKQKHGFPLDQPRIAVVVQQQVDAERAVVAREYGIPCVSGVTGATDTFRDGQLVEVDGSNGVVRILESKA